MVITGDLQNLRSSIQGSDKMKLGFNKATLHTGKLLFNANAVNYTWHDQALWHNELDIEIYSGAHALH
jgi:hypothetical protein